MYTVFNNNKLQSTHYSAGLVVVEVHFLAEAASTLTCVHEHPSKLVPEIDVVRASAPFPILDSGYRVLDVRGPSLVRGVACASLDQALRARPGHRVCHARAGDRVNERRLPETCAHIQRSNMVSI